MVRGQRLEAIDTRWVFRIYAVLALAGGFFLFAWGQRWIGNDLPGLPWGKAALVRVAGAVVMAAGFCSLGFAAIEHPSVRRRALLWFTIAHGWIWFVMFIQQAAIWNSTLGDRTTGTLLVVTAVLSYLFTTSEGDTRPLELLGLFGSSLPAPTEALRSQYEQQIREAARRRSATAWRATCTTPSSSNSSSFRPPPLPRRHGSMTTRPERGSLSSRCAARPGKRWRRCRRCSINCGLFR